MSPDRRRQLLEFLRRHDLDPGGDPPVAAALLSQRLLLVEEALSHTSAGLGRNHEQLEFLGDAVLRLASAAFLQSEHPRLSVGQCSALRAQLVSDRWLAELAQRIELMPLIHLGAMAAGDRAGRATVQAECCEALVGAVYVGWGGPEGGLGTVQAWLTPHWRRDCAELLADPLRHNWKSALQEWSQGRGLGLPRYDCQERSRAHGDPRRFQCWVRLEASGLSALPEPLAAEGWGGSRREAEQQAARAALAALGVGKVTPRTSPG
jgi:ribonuclease III